MGLLNARNLRRAKQLLDKNRHKVGDAVEKAGTQLDKVSKGKTSSVTAKAADAAKKYSAGGTTHHGLGSTAPDPTLHAGPLPEEDARRRQANATASAAGAMSGVADALTNLINKAAAKAENTNASKQPAPPVVADEGTPNHESDRG